MKRSLLLHSLVVGLALVLGGVGCKMKPKNPTPIPGAQAKSVTPDDSTFGAQGGVKPLPPGGDTTGSNVGGTPGTGGPAGGEVPRNPADMKENRDQFRSDTVYFAFDRSDVRPGERSKIENVANYLKGHATDMVRIEGFCDERGTEGYNLALGERRALAVREYLMNLGIASDRIATLSYGEAKPADPGHNDAAWAKNRRDEFVLLTP